MKKKNGMKITKSFGRIKMESSKYQFAAELLLKVLKSLYFI